MADEQRKPFGDHQYAIYLDGVAGETPSLPIAMADLERLAEARLDPGARGYIAGGAGSEDTMRANLEAFRSWRIVPRHLRDVGSRSLTTTVLGTEMPAPILLAPIGVQSIAHPDAELATARAAASLGVPLVLSTASSTSIEEVAAAGGEAPRWFQLYWPRDPALAASFLERAERAGYGAIVVTLDTTLLAWRPRDLQLGYLPFLRGEGIANYLTDPVFRGALARPPEEDMSAAIFQFVSLFSDPTKTWADLGRLREQTRLPVLLKGVLSEVDARLAVEHGIDGLIVSNHGGRQVDGAVAALDALPGVVGAVPEGYPVLVDSGVRGGADVVKAMALGARAVLLGRPYVWGLALAGEEGVRHVLRCVLAELDLTMALSGHASPATLGRDVLRH